MRRGLPAQVVTLIKVAVMEGMKLRAEPQQQQQQATATAGTQKEQWQQ